MLDPLPGVDLPVVVRTVARNELGAVSRPQTGQVGLGQSELAPQFRSGEVEGVGFALRVIDHRISNYLPCSLRAKS